MQMSASGTVVDERGAAGKLVSITIGATIQPCRASQPCDVICELSTTDRTEGVFVVGGVASPSVTVTISGADFDPAVGGAVVTVAGATGYPDGWPFASYDFFGRIQGLR